MSTPEPLALAALAALVAGGCDAGQTTAIPPDHTAVGPYTGRTIAVWTELDELALATPSRLHRLSSAGHLIGTETLLERRPVDIQFVDGAYGLIADDETRIVLERFSGDGVSLGPTVAVAGPASRADLEWTGSEYALARNDDPLPARFEISRFDAAGEVVAAPIDVEVEPVPLAGEDGLIWTGSGYLVVWSREADLWLLELSVDATPIGSPVRVLEDVLDPQVLWTGQHVAVIAGRSTGEPVFFRFAASGQLLGDVVALEGFDCCQFDTFRATDSGYVIAGSGDPTVLAKLDAAGNLIDQIPVGSGVAPRVEALAWTGSQIALAYSAADELGDRQLLFQLVDL